jgi:2-methylisocitrate lyase-like PEP mutase family enzyme
MSRAASFRGLHAPGEARLPLLLPNAWDAASARLFEAAGARAVATTSAAVAWAHGLPDGEAIPREALVASVASMTRVLGVPLTVDLERGYARAPEDVAAVVRRIVDAGAVGINLEDGGGDDANVARLAANIAAARGSAQRAGVDLFINARTDLALRGEAGAEHLVEAALGRACVYEDAGADGFFVPGLTSRATIAAIARGTRLPLNVMLGSGLPPLPLLQQAGVRRISAGPRLAELAFEGAQRACRAFLAEGSLPAFATEVTYPVMNALLRAG